MSVTSAMFTGVSGLLANAEGINVIGNNLANVNTVGFKSGRMLFSDMLSADIGNNSQIGRGTMIQKVDNLFTQSSFESTENVTDLALQGNSFFALKAPSSTGPLTQNQALLTRAGAFRVDANLTLVNPDGYQVLDTQGNAIRFSDNAAGIAAALATLTTELAALQTKTATLDASAQALVNAADADFATATAALPGLLAPLQTKATDLDTSAADLVTAATAAVTAAQTDLKTTLSPLQAKATVLDTKALALQDAADAAVTTATEALYEAGGPSGSLQDLSDLLNGVVGTFDADIAALSAAVTKEPLATPAEVAASNQIVAGLTAAQTAVANAILAPDDPAVIATAQQAVNNLTTLITNSSGIFVDHAPGANLQATYAAINPAPVEAQALVVAGDATTLATALTAQTTADSVKNATAAALTQVDTAYNAAAPTVAQANDALLALTNAGTIISGASAVFAATANAEYICFE